MSQGSNFVSVDKAEATNILLKHIGSYHTLIEEESNKIDENSLKITSFLTRVWKDDLDDFKKENEKINDISILHAKLNRNINESRHPVIFQYALENQTEFETAMKVISKAASSIYPIVENFQKEIFALMRPQQNQPQPTGEGSQSTTIMMPQQKGPSILDSIFRFGRTRLDNVTDINASTRSTNIIDETLQVPVFLSKYRDYHWHGVTKSMHLLSGNIRAQRFYLTNELRYFHTMVEPKIQQITEEARRLKIMEEKKIIAPILAAAREMADRRSMQPVFT